jgi:hypothetical protein
MQEKTLYAHMCENKRRAMQKDEKRVQAGFLVFNRFFRLTQGAKKDKTYEDFTKSPYYNAFVKFGSFINNVSPLYPDKFIDYVIKSGVKIDHWCRDATYTEYLTDYLRKESVTDALSRAVEYSITWAETHSHPAHDFLRYGNNNAIAYAISTGRISAWVLYNSESGQAWLENMDNNRDKITPILATCYGVDNVQVWRQRWRIFFMACAELWGYKNGEEWIVSHYLFEKK